MQRTPSVQTPQYPQYVGPAATAPASTATYAGYGGARKFRKSSILAVVLAFLFGPLGLFYASKKSALLLLAFLLGPHRAVQPRCCAWRGARQSIIGARQLRGDEPDVVAFRFLSIVWSVMAVRIHDASA